MPNPWLTVVIPTFNRRAVVARTIGSVRRQDPQVEIIISDDGSSDDIEDAIRSFNAQGAEVRLVKSRRNTGASGARNRGAAVAQGRWLLFLDSDDELVPGSLARLRDHLLDHAPEVVCVYATDVTPDGKTDVQPCQFLPPHLDAAELMITEKRPFTQSQILIEAGRFKSVKGFDETLRQSEDIDLWLRLVGAGARISVLREALVNRYNDQKSSLSANVPELYRSQKMLWRKHAASLRRRLDRDQLQRWRMARIDNLYAAYCARTGRRGRLKWWQALDYCRAWAVLALTLSGKRRQVARDRLVGAFRSFVADRFS